MISEKNHNQKINCSVGILTFNSEKTLLKCLESVSNFSEIIICDGGSTDKTIEIAKKFNCIILQQDYKYKYKNNKISDFSGVRNQTLERASCDWFMFIDSDEFLSIEVVDELSKIVELNDNKKGAYKMPRKFILEGNIIDCASSYPNYQMRFFRKSCVDMFIKKVHERIHIQKDMEIGILRNHVMVPIDSDPKSLKKKHAYYLSIEYQRSVNQPYLVLFTAVRFNARVILVRLFKYSVTLIICRGTRMPVEREFINIRYSLRLLLIILKLILKKLFYDIKRIYTS
jgi:glycosyltransferase involved in cell wall biosynthesis